MQEADILVPDTSAIVEGLVSSQLGKRVRAKKVMVHEATVSELEGLAKENKEIGFLGIEELQKIRELADDLEFSGTRPRSRDLSDTQSLIRELAWEKGATLLTADKIQARIASAKGIDCIFLDVEKVRDVLKLESFFDKSTMSVHLRENVPPIAKKGRPGNWRIAQVKKTPMRREDVVAVAREIVEEASIRRDCFIEIERPGSTIVQLEDFRIVITKPPFSDGWEITAVRPVRRLSLSDYPLSEKLKDRLSEKAEGILIAGAPGHGKSTFAQAVAEHYSDMQKVVKTVEAPRDLVLPESITQYAISHGSPEEIHDILLLSRPDYTIFDEMRNTDDFRLFADMRLSGVGMIGVIHATNPIDAIQRFVGRIELGVIPQVIDTVIFIKDGGIEKVLSLNMTVKVPSGMTEADLARPVVVVNDFETKRLDYELYSYGEETVVVPVRSGASEETPSRSIAARSIANYLRQFSEKVKVEIVSDHKCVAYVPPQDAPKIIGKAGKTINEIEKDLGISIDVKDLDEKAQGIPLDFDSKISKKSVVFELSEDAVGKSVDILHEGDFVLTVAVGKNGQVKISRKNKIGKMLVDALNMGERIQIVLKETKDL